MGGNIKEELSFVHYYHHHKMNQILHMVSLFFIHYVAISYLKNLHHFSINLSFLLASIYFLFFSYLDLFVGLLYLSIFILHYFSSIQINLFLTIFLIVFFLLGQLLGHLVFEKKFPAFRLFEAGFTTPFFCLLRILFFFGYKNDLFEEIKVLTPKWKGSERFIL